VGVQLFFLLQILQHRLVRSVHLLAQHGVGRVSRTCWRGCSSAEAAADKWRGR
jgi:hypothetical protein